MQWISVPFAQTHPAVGSLAPSVTDWIGAIDPGTPWVWGEWIDYYVLLIFGGIPWQVSRGEEQGWRGSYEMCVFSCFVFNPYKSVTF